MQLRVPVIGSDSDDDDKALPARGDRRHEQPRRLDQLERIRTREDERLARTASELLAREQRLGLQPRAAVDDGAIGGKQDLGEALASLVQDAASGRVETAAAALDQRAHVAGARPEAPIERLVEL